MKKNAKTGDIRTGQFGASETILFRVKGQEEGVGFNRKIAAANLDDVVKYMARRYKAARVMDIRHKGLIEVVSGSPLD